MNSVSQSLMAGRRGAGGGGAAGAGRRGAAGAGRRGAAGAGRRGAAEFECKALSPVGNEA